MEPAEGERVSVRVSSREPVRAKLVDEPLPGYAVDATDLDSAVTREDAGLTIAASRHGSRLRPSRLDELAEATSTAAGDDASVDREFTVAFGAPERGLPAILDVPPGSIREEGETGRFDLWLNTVPNQGSGVVRTEEAMFATLACLNLME